LVPFQRHRIIWARPCASLVVVIRYLSTHAVGAGCAGQPVLGSQHNTLPAADLVPFDTAVGVAKTQFPEAQPHGEAFQPCQPLKFRSSQVWAARTRISIKIPTSTIRSCQQRLLRNLCCLSPSKFLRRWCWRRRQTKQRSVIRDWCSYRDIVDDQRRHQRQKSRKQ
jgi:hypothetical protein